MYRNRNSFKFNEKTKSFFVKKKEVNVKELDFPELVTTKKTEQKTEQETESSNNYLEMVKKQNNIEEKNDENFLQEGYMRLTKEKSGVTNVEYNLETTNYLKDESIDLTSCVERWEKYKNDYIELYGEDTYNKMYLFPNPIEFPIIDNDEEELYDSDEEYE